MRPSRSLILLAAALVLAPSAPLPAQSNKALDITEEILDRFFTAHEKEKNESSGLSSELQDTDAKIAKFEQCKRDFEAAGSATGSRLGGIAARVAIKAKCGASDADGYRKERERIMAGPENSAAAAGGFKVPEYRNLRDRLRGYLNGDRSGFTKGALDLLKSREGRLAATFGISMNSGGGGGRGMRTPAVWTTDFAWIWISQLFAVQYLSGATMFEKDYAPGDWTKWTVKVEDEEEVQTVERAFIGRQADGGEWWRMKTVTISGDEADTVSLEALFRPEPDNDYLQKLVRMRAKLPGNDEPQEMMVPEQWATWNMMGAFPYKPTQESIDGATIGMEDVKTAAGTFRAKHVRFGQGGGTLEWWLVDESVGGWVKFAAVDNDKQPRYTMELAGRGTGAKSELGVVIK
ncbi:MAG: hypothetical protein JNL44_06280 [Gemmatimonadetes bacterium]|nr:hypothetical protein [Gemmatimonadota bacterium]